MMMTMMMMVILMIMVMTQLMTLTLTDAGEGKRLNTTSKKLQHLQVKNTNPPPGGVGECHLSPQLVAEIQGYQETVDHIIDYVVHGGYKGQAYHLLAELVDTFGHRLSGSKQLEDAIDWMLEVARSEGLDNAYTEDVTVPVWVRNNESLWMTRPRLQELNMLALGRSVGTPPGGIRAEVLVVRDFKDLERQAKKAAGKIVVYNSRWRNYHEAVQYRMSGAVRAAKVGAVATLVSSLTPFSLNTPHTGYQTYGKSLVKIPAAYITVEDAAMLERMQRRGQKVEVVLTMGAQNSPATTSRNTVTEVKGREWPRQVVVVSGHLDSWDVGQGALDDGGGSVISWCSGVVLKRLGLRPRRTLRAVLFTGEEQHFLGGQAYFDRHQDEREKYQLILESDTGTFTPRGLAFTGTQKATCIMREILHLLQPINATQVCCCLTQVLAPMYGGPDITMWEKVGVPTGSLHSPDERYFWYHHSHGDTLSVIESGLLDLCLAVWTVIAYVTADITHNLPHLSL
ncbi:carboxypeptidase Q-like [Homarus americanus]|uniref:carboxypeptidase Q-like n=1 Tax=Homarus americanus TaxID=6706 RepID=UPI001C4933B3|nr:carboxypeptidase Q-like [Homarus americanus]